MPGPQNVRRYPAIGFNRDGTIVDGLAEVQESLPTRNSRAVLNFLVRPDGMLKNAKPIDVLRPGDTERTGQTFRRRGRG